MKKLALVAGLVLAASLAAAPLAFAQDTTRGVSQADADAACAGVVDARAAFDAAYATTDNTDDGPAQTALGAAEANLRAKVNLHVESTGLSFSCEGRVAVFQAPPVTTTPPVTPEPTTPPATTSPVEEPPAEEPDAEAPLYATCQEAFLADDLNMPVGHPGYRTELDSDGDGIACEEGSDGDSPLPEDADGDFDQVGTIPSGAIDTGRA